MSNLFTSSNAYTEFSLKGRIEGRAALGNEMPILMHRLMQFTMFDVLTKELGIEKAQEFFREAGYLSGLKYAESILDLDLSFDTFVPALQKSLIDLRICILTMEVFSVRTGEIILRIGEALNGKSLPITDETVCYYDEGFIAGILDSYTGKKYTVREIDCWESGDRICRFRATVSK